MSLFRRNQKLKTHSQEAQLTAIKAEMTKCKENLALLQQQLEERTQEVNQLIQWTQSLQQDILAVYNSITWQMGHFITQIALKLLRRPVGPTARDHIDKTLATFESWKINYFQHRKSQGLQTYRPWHDTREYALWIKQYDRLDSTTQAQMRVEIEHWSYCPILSILMPVIDDNPNEQWLQQAIQSIQTQIYPHWELCLVHRNPLSEPLLKLSQSDNRIQLIHYQTGSDFFNPALAAASGDFVALMGADDRLPNHAFYQLVKQLNSGINADIVYSDEDKLDEQGQRYDPFFKSDWNPDLFYSQHFLRHLTLYRRSLVNQIGGFQAIYQGYEDYDLILRLIEHIKNLRILHVPDILYHQRNSTLIDTQIAGQVLQAHFQRLHQPVEVVETFGGHTRIVYPLSTKPLVSLIIPTRDKLKLLRGTVESLLNQTDYQPFELIIVDNGSVESETLAYLEQIQKDNNISVIHHAAPFNYSQLNNLAVSQAQGEIIGLINNDLEVIASEWLTEMVSQALRPEIGAVGAKLYYANDTIQHAGVIVGLGGMAGHGFKFLAREAPGYYWKPFLVQNYSAVTGACLVMRRQIFEEVGGLEEKHLKVAFNDVDLCLRIRQRGYRILWSPYAELYHLESASRGFDNTVKKYLRLRHELNFMKKRWGPILDHDPYYNPNLTIEYEDFSLAYPPRYFN